MEFNNNPPENSNKELDKVLTKQRGRNNYV